MTSDVSTAIADFATETGFSKLPGKAVHAASRASMDAIGVMAAASGMCDEVRPFIDHARAGGTGACTILGTGSRTSAPMAAFANGAMAHALDYEDVFDAAPCHPNASAIPAALAVAQQLRGISGKEFLAAVAVGCDVVCRLALATHKVIDNTKWYPPPILGAWGAAIAVTKLTGGDRRAMLDTLSMLLLQVTAPAAIRFDKATSLRATREAFPAQAAVTASILATSGTRGFGDPLGGRGGFAEIYADGRFDANLLLRDVGERFFIEELSFKRWPACRGTHAAIEMALSLLQDDGIDWRMLTQIELTVGRLQAMLAEPLEQKQSPSSLIDAKFSLPFMTAVAFVHGRVSLANMQPPILEDRDVLSLAKRVTVRVDSNFADESGTAANMKVKLNGGKALHRSCQQPTGSAACPMTDEQLVDKFVECVGLAENPPRESVVREVAGRLLSLDRESDVGQLIEHLFPKT